MPGETGEPLGRGGNARSRDGQRATVQQDGLQQAEVVKRMVNAAGAGDPLALAHLTVIYGMQGKTREMIALLNKALSIKPDFPKALKAISLNNYSTPSDRASANFDLACVLFLANDYDNGCISLRTTKTSRPDSGLRNCSNDFHT